MALKIVPTLEITDPKPTKEWLDSFGLMLRRTYEQMAITISDIDDRIAIGIRVSTGSVGAGARVDVVVTWTTPFADTNYTPIVSVVETSAAGTGIVVERIRDKTTSSITVQVLNESAGALTGTLQAVAVRD